MIQILSLLLIGGGIVLGAYGSLATWPTATPA